MAEQVTERRRPAPPGFYKPPPQKTNRFQINNNDMNIQVMKKFTPQPPRTVTPQVAEGGRAEQAGVKLGDTVCKINDKDSTNMSLGEAHEAIQKAGDDLSMTVQEFDEEDDIADKPKETREIRFRGKRSESEFDGLLPPRGTILEEQLRTMRKKLKEIASIPEQIQSTLADVAMKIEQFLPPEPEPELEPKPEPEIEVFVIDKQFTIDDENNVIDSDSVNENDVVNEENQSVLPEKWEADSITEESIENPVQLENIVETDEHDQAKDCDPIETIEEDEIQTELKIKLEKLERLEKSWPWRDAKKIIYKRSNCHLVPSTALMHQKIKQLEDFNHSYLNY